MKRHIKMFLAMVLVFALMIPMSAMAWTETNYYTKGGSGGRARLTLSLSKETSFMGATYFGCFAAKQFFYDANLRMEKFTTGIYTNCANTANNKSYSSTSTNTNSSTTRTKQVANGYDDTNIVAFTLSYYYSSAAFGSESFGRTVSISQV